MEQFDFENTTIFKELNKLSSDENYYFFQFIVKKDYETNGNYFTKKFEKLKSEGDLEYEFKNIKTDESSVNHVSFFGDKFIPHENSSWSPHKHGYNQSYERNGIEFNVFNNKTISSHWCCINYVEPKTISLGLFGIKKIKVLSKEESRDFKLYQKVYDSDHWTEFTSESLSYLSKKLSVSKYEFVIKFIKHYNSLLEGSLMDYRESINKEKELLRIKKEKIIVEIVKSLLQKQKTSEKKDSLIKELDKDSDGILDIVQTDDFQEILKKHEKNIIEIDRDYIKNFVKLSNYLKTIRNNLQNTFEILSKVEFSKDLVPLTKILKNKIHTYNSLLLHSLSMIVSLTKDEMITFYEIYEMFDELNVYDSKHEKDMLNGIKSINSELGEVNKNLKEVGSKLGDISGQFYSLMNQMKESDERIVNSIDNLTYTTSSSIESLSNNVQSELQSINSSIKFNNLLTGVQTYQMYKINLNTKSLKG